MRSRREIEEQINLAAIGVAEGSKYPGMSYEEGVKEALDWVLENIDDKPMEEE